MAFKIIWSEEARDDLQSIVLYIAGIIRLPLNLSAIYSCPRWMRWRNFRNWVALCRKKMTKQFVKLYIALTALFTKSWLINKLSPLRAFGMARVANRKSRVG